MTNQLKYKCECGWTSTGDRCKATCPECGSTELKVEVNTDEPSVNDTRKETAIDNSPDADVYHDRFCGPWRG